MPAYKGDSIRISLSTASLEQSTSEDALALKKIDASQNELKKISAEFISNSVPLQELAIFPETEKTSLRFIGAHEEIPFYLMNAGSNLYRDSSAIRSRLSALALEPPKIPSTISTSPQHDLPNMALNYNTQVQKMIQHPSSSSSNNSVNTALEASIYRQALCLSIKLKTDAFLPSPLTSTPHNQSKYQDIKIDVFFNGDRCASTLVPSTVRVDCGGIPHVELFHGKRQDLTVEIPWILIPLGQTADGRLRETKRLGKGSSEVRWAAINERLREEAIKAVVNVNKPTVLGEYVEALSQIEIPPNVQTPGSAKFGVIDVVLVRLPNLKD
jgi:hypothetical protein